MGKMKTDRKNTRVALIGLDGSGKSTNIDQMKTDPDYGCFRFLWVRWKPTLMKPVYMLMGKRIRKNHTAEQRRTDAGENAGELHTALDEDYRAKHDAKKRIFRSPLIRHIWTFLAVTDYFFQFYFKATKALVTRKPIVFDRFYLDLFVDQGINFGYTPKQIARLIRRHRWLFPRIRKYIYLKVSPGICFQRKNDIPNMEYLQKRHDIYEYLAQTENWITINGEEQQAMVYHHIKCLVLGDSKSEGEGYGDR